MEIPFLCQVRPAGEWLITRCVNCGIDTHAVSSNNHVNRVLISKELEGDPAKQDILTHNPHYSQAFKIILNYTNSDDKLNGNNGVPFNDTSMLEYSNCLNRKSAELLKKERASMLERISLYTAEQHAQYAKLQSAIHNEQQFILKRIMDIRMRTIHHPAEQQQTKTASNVAKPYEFPAKINEPMKKHSDGEHAALPINDPKTDTRRDFPPKRNDKKKSLRTFAHRKHPALGHGLSLAATGLNLSRSLDMNAIFSMDELESSSDEDFGEEDLESEDEVEELSQSNSTTSASSHSLYATSLPVAMPGRKRRPIAHHITNHFELESDSESDPFKTTNPEEIAASIQALAQSVHGNDGTEMFGGLPRPRLNTLG